MHLVCDAPKCVYNIRTWLIVYGRPMHRLLNVACGVLLPCVCELVVFVYMYASLNELAAT